MDPVTLHFNVFQAGLPIRTTYQCEDPRGTTILALKQELFGDEIKASKSVRFIAAGKILQDATAVEVHKLGREAHIHVSISDGPSSSPSSPVRTSPGDPILDTAEATTLANASSSNASGSSMVVWAILAGVTIFLGTGALLYVAFQKRRQYTMHTSQLLFICAAIWVYLLIFHGLPALLQAISKLGSSSAPKESASWGITAPRSPTSGAAGVGEEVTGGTGSSTASPAPASSPGLSLMTPTLPPADASAAAVLTQRR